MDIMAKQSFWQGEMRVDYSVISCENFGNNNKKAVVSLLETIAAYDKAIN